MKLDIMASTVIAQHECGVVESSFSELIRLSEEELQALWMNVYLGILIESGGEGAQVENRN